MLYVQYVMQSSQVYDVRDYTHFTEEEVAT